MRLVAQFDGGSLSNPGAAACGTVIYELRVIGERTRLVRRVETGRFLGDPVTSNEAEYHGLILALHALRPIANINDYITIQGDSDLIIQQMLGRYQVLNSRLATLKQTATDLIASSFKGIIVRLEHIPRESNTVADDLVKQALSRRSHFERYPSNRAALTRQWTAAMAQLFVYSQEGTIVKIQSIKEYLQRLCTVLEVELADRAPAVALDIPPPPFHPTGCVSVHHAHASRVDNCASMSNPFSALEHDQDELSSSNDEDSDEDGDDENHVGNSDDEENHADDNDDVVRHSDRVRQNRGPHDPEQEVQCESGGIGQMRYTLARCRMLLGEYTVREAEFEARQQNWVACVDAATAGYATMNALLIEMDTWMCLGDRDDDDDNGHDLGQIDELASCTHMSRNHAHQLKDRIVSEIERRRVNLLRKLTPQWQDRDQVKQRMGEQNWKRNPTPKNDFKQLREILEQELHELNTVMIKIDQLEFVR